MFRKVHYRLTLLCAGTTIAILLVMSLIYLYVSETGLSQSQFLSFQHAMDNFVHNFKQQNVITHEWLSHMEANNSYWIRITDNGVPLLFNQRKLDQNRLAVEEEALACFSASFSVENTDPSDEDTDYHLEFPFTASTGADYYACVARISQEQQHTEILVLYPLQELNAKIKSQRLHFALIDLAAVFLLSLFSFFFTKKLLAPIEQNRKEQIQFVAAASHELRTPLAVILSSVSAIKKASPEEEENFLSTIDSEGRRMSRLINDMLLLSQADARAFPIRLQPVECDTLLLNSFESFEPMAKEKNISFAISLPQAALPPCLCDAERFRQVIAILLHNAISYTPSGGSISMALSLDTVKKSETLVLSVIDNGIGIPDEEKEKIFQRFYRSDRSRSIKDHFGLGLPIASEIVRSLGGTIHVADTPGGGSTFLVCLPFRFCSKAPMFDNHKGICYNKNTKKALPTDDQPLD